MGSHEQLRDLFERAMDRIEISDFETVVVIEKELSFCAAPAAAIAVAKALLSFRVAILKGVLPETPPVLGTKIDGFEWLQAEEFFFRGIFYFHRGDFPEGTRSFESAAVRFKSVGNRQRQFLSEFNVYVGKCNSHVIQTAEQEWLELLSLERRIAGDGCEASQVLAMISRDKADILQNSERPIAALDEAKRAAELFRGVGPQPDFHLAALYVADLCVELDRREEAISWIEQVMPPLEARVAFPLAFLRWRLGGAPVRLESFEVVPPRWRDRYEQILRGSLSEAKTGGLRVANWDLSRAQLTFQDSGLAYALRTGSLEGKLVRLLAEGRASRHVLCRTLWPELDNVRVLDNRLHVLVSRTNKKISDLIEFDGKLYGLRAAIRIA